MTALVLAVGLVVLIGIVFLGFRLSAWSMGEVRHVVSRWNDALAEVGAATGLRYVGGNEYRHPIAGSIPTYGSLQGVYRDRGVEVSADLRHDERPSLSDRRRCRTSWMSP